MSSTADIAFVFLPTRDTDRLFAGTLDCDVTAFEHRAQCRIITSQATRGGERQQAQLRFENATPSWFRPGLTLRLWRGDKTFGAAIVQSASA